MLVTHSLCLCRVELAGSAQSGSSLPVVDCGDVENVVASWTGIPVERMAQDEKDKLMQLVSTLHVRGCTEVPRSRHNTHVSRR